MRHFQRYICILKKYINARIRKVFLPETTMNKNLINLIIVVVSFVLLSLTAVQLYWVRNVISIERTNFENKVNTAVYEVIDQLERMKTLSTINQNTNSHQQLNNFLISIDSINQEIFKTITDMDNTEDIKMMIRKTMLAQEAINEMMNQNQAFDIERHLNPKILDSLLHKEIKGQGINTPFEYGVISSSNMKMVINKSKKYSSELEKEGYVFTLYPYEFVENPYFLTIFFPYEIRYLFKQMATIIFISLILIVVTLMLFIYIIKVIVWQKRLSEMKSDFINNMTHEIKTPISTISLACEALRDNEIKKNQILSDNYLKVINDENMRLGGIAEKILQAAAIEKDNFKLKREKVYLHDLIDEVINNITIQVEVKDGKINKDFRATKALIQCDKMHITSVISNLIDNANKYTPRKPVINIVTENYAEGIKVCISDNGVGISSENKKKIFDKLYRVPTGNIHDVKGFGLGLSYVQTIVESHGGKTTVDSELKKGSTFCIYLPASGKPKQKNT